MKRRNNRFYFHKWIHFLSLFVLFLSLIVVPVSADNIPPAKSTPPAKTAETATTNDPKSTANSAGQANPKETSVVGAEKKQTAEPKESKAKAPIFFDGKSLATAGGVEVPETTCYSAFVINLETGSVIFTKHENDFVYPTSTTKLMTALVALENIPDLNTVYTASENAVKITEGTHIGIKAGEQYTANDLLHALLIGGANDAANVLAESVGGSVDNFCKLMNDKAAKLGALKTHYTNPTGIHDPDMVTTANDTALIATAAYYNNTLFEITNTGRYELPKSNLRKDPLFVYNRNSFISQTRGTEYYYQGALGLNSGSTAEGGWCLVTTAAKKGLTYLCVVMNAKEDTVKKTVSSYSDAKALLDMCFANFANQKVVSPKKLICEIAVKNSAEVDHMTLYPKDEIQVLLPVTLNSKTDLKLDSLVYNEHVSAPVKKGDTFGELTVLYKGTVILGKTKLVAQTEIDRSNLLYFFSSVEEFLQSRWFRATALVAVILFLLYLALAFTIRLRGNKYQYKNSGRKK